MPVTFTSCPTIGESKSTPVVSLSSVGLVGIWIPVIRTLVKVRFVGKTVGMIVGVMVGTASQ